MSDDLELYDDDERARILNSAIDQIADPGIRLVISEQIGALLRELADAHRITARFGQTLSTDDYTKHVIDTALKVFAEEAEQRIAADLAAGRLDVDEAELVRGYLR